MPKNKKLRKKFKRLLKKQLKADEEQNRVAVSASGLSGLVLRDFNRYLEDFINPDLLSNYRLEKSERAYYFPGSRNDKPGFEIISGRLKKPENSQDSDAELREVVEKIVTYRNEYVNRKKWIKAIYLEL